MLLGAIASLLILRYQTATLKLPQWRPIMAWIIVCLCYALMLNIAVQWTEVCIRRDIHHWSCETILTPIVLHRVIQEEAMDECNMRRLFRWLDRKFDCLQTMRDMYILDASASSANPSIKNCFKKLWLSTTHVPACSIT